jgi:hypothetical protein
LHTGFTIAYPFIQKLFDNENISIEREKLYEPKSLLNEDVTKLGNYNIKLEYKHIDNRATRINNEKYITKAILYNSRDNTIIIETPEYRGATKQETEQKAARYIINLKEYKELKKYYNIP